MRHPTTLALAASAMMLAGCGSKPVPANGIAAAPDDANVTTVPEDETPPPTDTASPVDQPTPPADAATEPSDDQPETAADAARVVQAYYADIDHGDFRAAYARWGNDGQDSHQSFADFKRGFAHTATTSATTGTPTNGEGAAGSSFIDVPVTVRARLKDGTRQRFTGHYTLRRVNDVPGSTQAQRRWHLYSATLEKG